MPASPRSNICFPTTIRPKRSARRCAARGLTQALFNLPPGDWAAGERGMAALADRAAEAGAGGRDGHPLCRRDRVPHPASDGRQSPIAPIRARSAAYRALAAAKRRAAGARADITLVLEPINSRDMPGYFLNDFDYAAELIGDLGLPNLASFSSTSITARSCMATWSWACGR